MNDDELISEFFNTSVKGNSIVISVKRITWDGPCNPKSRWRKAATLPTTATEPETNAEIRKLLLDKRFFQVCSECHERCPTGCMVSEFCHGCGQQNHGIVF